MGRSNLLSSQRPDGSTASRFTNTAKLIERFRGIHKSRWNPLAERRKLGMPVPEKTTRELRARAQEAEDPHGLPKVDEKACPERTWHVALFTDGENSFGHEQHYRFFHSAGVEDILAELREEGYLEKVDDVSELVIIPLASKPRKFDLAAYYADLAGQQEDEQNRRDEHKAKDELRSLARRYPHLLAEITSKKGKKKKS